MSRINTNHTSLKRIVIITLTTLLGFIIVLVVSIYAAYYFRQNAIKNEEIKKQQIINETPGKLVGVYGRLKELTGDSTKGYLSTSCVQQYYGFSGFWRCEIAMELKINNSQSDYLVSMRQELAELGTVQDYVDRSLGADNKEETYTIAIDDIRCKVTATYTVSAATDTEPLPLNEVRLSCVTDFTYQPTLVQSRYIE